jgi:hypothetical protein
MQFRAQFIELAIGVDRFLGGNRRYITGHEDS